MAPNGRARTTLLALALLAAVPLSAGCLDAAGAKWDDVRASVGVPPDEVSAKSARNEADAAARAWHPDARLESVSTVEWTADSPARDTGEGDDEDDFPSDPDVGNGRAPAWLFEYVAPGEEYEFLVYANGTIAFEERDEEDDEDYHELANASEWRVDSDDAMDRLRDEPEWREQVERMSPHMVVNNLQRNETDTVWAFLAYDRQWQGVVGLVDATTGDVEGVHAWNWSGMDWDWDWNGSWSGSGDWGDWNAFGRGNITYQETYRGELSRLETQHRYKFPVAAPGQVIEIEAETETGSIATGLQIRILDPDGKEIPVHSDTGDAYGPRYRESFSAQATAAGTHTLIIALENTAVYAEYEADLSVGSGHSMDWDWAGDASER